MHTSMRTLPAAVRVILVGWTSSLMSVRLISSPIGTCNGAVGWISDAYHSVCKHVPLGISTGQVRPSIPLMK